MTEPTQNPPQQVFVRSGGTHRSTGQAAAGTEARTTELGEGGVAATAAASTAEAERPVGGIDVLYFEDDPSDMELVLELPDGHVVAVPLTEMKATRLRRALDAQQLAAARMRHELAGGTPDTFEPLPVPSAGMGEYGAAEQREVSYGDGEYADDEYADDEEESPGQSLGVRERVNRRMDVAGVRDVAGEAMGKDVKGVPVWWFVLGVLAVSMILSVFSTLGGWL